MLVERAMAIRHLTPEEEDREQERRDQLDAEDDALSSQKQWTNVKALGILLIALVLLIITFKKGGSGDDEDAGDL